MPGSILAALGLGALALSCLLLVISLRMRSGPSPALDALNLELETIFNAASSSIVALDHEGSILRINTNARHLLSEISGTPPFGWPRDVQFLDAETLAPQQEEASPVHRALHGQALQSEIYLLQRSKPGQDQRYVRVSSARLQSPDHKVRAVLVLDDVTTAEKDRQAIERKNRLDALGKLTGGIAHDFNNLLASQLYAIELAIKEEDPHKRGALLQTGALIVRRGQNLTGRLLAFAKRQPGLATAHLVGETLADFERLVRPMLEAQIQLDVTAPDPGLLVYCDQTQLETALMNLALNSRDAILEKGGDGRIEITAREVALSAKDRENRHSPPRPKAASSDAVHRYVEISVTDTGTGMNAETLERCTDPFFTTKDGRSGNGLGLAMVYGFTRQSDGEFNIYSEETLGTTVRLLLPCGTRGGHREGALSDPEEIAAGKGQLILVVEDEEHLLSMITQVIENFGYEVLPARSGREALELLGKGTRFDLLLTDIVMPDKISGFELARRVREMHPDMPVLYMSGYTGFSTEEMGDVRAPVLQKPCPPVELSRAIEAALSATS